VANTEQHLATSLKKSSLLGLVVPGALPPRSRTVGVGCLRQRQTTTVVDDEDFVESEEDVPADDDKGLPGMSNVMAFLLQLTVT
jgi:hypothetical protein